MKRISLLIASMLCATAIVGCKTVSAPLPAWAPNAQIAITGSVISSAVSVVNGYEQDQRDCAAQPTLTKCPGVSNAAIHSAVSNIQKALTIAQPEFNAWETAVRANPVAGEPADLIAAISTLQTTLAQLPTLTK